MKRLLSLLLVSTLLVLSLAGCGKEKEDDTSSTKKTSISESVDVSIDKPLVSVSTSDNKDPEIENPEPETPADAVVLDDVRKHAFYDVLASMQYKFGYYFWQFDYDFGGYMYSVKGDNPVISFADVDGDGLNELITICADEYNSTDAVLRVFGVDENGDAVELLNFVADSFDSGTGFMFLMSEGKMYLIMKNIYEGSLAKIFTFAKIYGDCYEPLEVASLGYVFEEDTDYNVYVDGVPATEAAFEACYDNILKNATDVMLYNKDLEFEVFDIGSSSMTYGEAIRIVAVNENVEEGELPFYETCNFEFASGVGGWSTDFTISKDGSFIGQFHDSDMGDTGEGYENGTVYYSYFEGNFTDIIKLDDNTYVMTLDGWTMEGTDGEESIEGEVRYVNSLPYGIEEGKVFLLYLPGTPVVLLPEDFVSWVYDLNNKDYLPNFGILNDQTGYGFFCYY